MTHYRPKYYKPSMPFQVRSPNLDLVAAKAEIKQLKEALAAQATELETVKAELKTQAAEMKVIRMLLSNREAKKQRFIDRYQNKRFGDQPKPVMVIMQGNDVADDDEPMTLQEQIDAMNHEVFEAGQAAYLKAVASRKVAGNE